MKNYISFVSLNVLICINENTTAKLFKESIFRVDYVI